MDNTIKFSVNRNEEGSRIDVFLTNKLNNFTRSNIKKFINNKCVKINNNIIISASKKIKVNDNILIKLIVKKSNKLVGKKIELDIRYEDNDIIVLNKPKGLVVHPGAGNYDNTLVNALVYKYKNKLSNIGGNLRPGIVHRIDKETSGVIVVAKNNLSHAKLGKQFNDHSIDRKYLCLVWGVIRPLNGKIETLICRSKKNRQLMAVSDLNGKKAVTNYKTIQVFNIKEIPKISLIECKLETGRTHQIRVHMKYKGAPVLADKQYGKRNIKFKKINEMFLDKLSDLNGQALHAQSLGFLHPTKDKRVSFKSELPLDFKKLLDFLKKLSS